jgi:hypothetical protein
MFSPLFRVPVELVKPLALLDLFDLGLWQRGVKVEVEVGMDRSFIWSFR